MAAIVLIHGPMQDASCWDRVLPMLNEHDVRTITLPPDRPDFTATDFARVVVNEMRGLPDDVVVVAHSMSGILLPRIASVRPVGAVIFVAAVIPQIGLSVRQQFERDPSMLHVWPDGIDWAGRQDELLFHDVFEGTLPWARTTIRPMQFATALEEALEVQFDGAVNVLCKPATLDRVINLEWQLRVARELWPTSPGGRAGTGHCPMVASPVEVAASIHFAASAERWARATAQRGACSYTPTPESEFTTATLEDYQGLSRQEQVALFNRTTYESRAAIVRTHAERWLEANRGRLSSAQTAYLTETISFLTAGLYDPAHREENAVLRDEMIARGYRLFEREELMRALTPH
jgi:pimeloyl-ACP methyl ester carboxylesterase